MIVVCVVLIFVEKRMVTSSNGSLNLQSPKWQGFEIFLPKLILEVFGAAGAVSVFSGWHTRTT